MAKKEATPAEPPITQLNNAAETIDGRQWLAGTGQVPANVMILGDRPTKEDNSDRVLFSGPAGRLLHRTLLTAGFDQSSVYWTNAVKYMLPGGKSPVAADIKRCRPLMMAEIERVQPKIILVLGSTALKALLGSGGKLTTMRGEFVPLPEHPGTQVFATYSPTAILVSPELHGMFKQDINKLVATCSGTTVTQDATDYRVVDNPKDLAGAVIEILKFSPTPLLAIDLEWQGVTWMHADRYTRTLQIGYALGKAIVVRFRLPGGGYIGDPANEQIMWNIIKEFFAQPGVKFVGHNIIADGEWLLSYGIDIRNQTVYDTMLAEYLVNESGPFDLGELCSKYTNMGRYWRALEEWKTAHSEECKHGYGAIPDELLIPYGAKDSDATLRVMVQQVKDPQLSTFFEPRGYNKEYPSLWSTTMRTQQLLYEIELNGVLVDTERLSELVTAYQTRRTELRSVLAQAVIPYGFTDFNPNSPFQIKELLFQKLGLTPVKTTTGKSWADYVGNQGMDDPAEFNPSTDGNTLELLQSAHPIVDTLLNYRRVEQYCKTWLKFKPEDEDPSTKGGGLYAKLWPDGRMHAHFSQLTDTGRFRTSKPNVQNWPKQADGVLDEVFGSKDRVPPAMRSIVVPPPGWVLMEGDFKQAELFVLAALSGDDTMMSALTTPGKDLHDLTAVNSFALSVQDSEGRVVPDDYLVELARKSEKEFEAFQKTLFYVNAQGKRLTRKEFKDTVRVSAKSLNFGIPYGRGALAIARAVKSETGSDLPLDQIKADIAQSLEAWKTLTYPRAWAYMMRCADAVTDPGYLINPWGRMRRFHGAKAGLRKDNSSVEALKRQAQNFNIQSTVADTGMVALDRMARYRAQHGMRFKIINQIHDAIMLEVPENEIEQCKTMFTNTMGNIDIPIGSGRSLRLGIDVEVMTRWGEKHKEQ